MKKLVLTTMIAIIALLAFAHPAGTQTLRFDPKTDYLYVNFDHSVKSATDHFIQSAIVQINGKNAVTQLMKSQDSTAGGALVYKLTGAKKGDKITVTTECNKGGKKVTSIVVP